MTRVEAYSLALRLEHELWSARKNLKDAQAQTRATGVRLPPATYNALWERVHRLERELEASRIQLANAQEAEAERFMLAARRLLRPEILARIEAAMAEGAR